MLRRTCLLAALILMLVGNTTSVAQDEPYAPIIDPANFVEGVDNPYFPFMPGTTFVYEGDTEAGREHIEVSVLPDTKIVLGVTCVVVRDTVWVDGALVEDTFDWYAQDRDGNVWYMGEDSKAYQNGAVVGTAGSWEAGVDGAQPGIIMEADPQPGDRYRQEYYAGEAEDMAEVLSLDESASVSYGSFDHLLMTNEWTPLEPDLAEHKSYAPGVGLVLEVMVEGGMERVELVNRVTWNPAVEEHADEDEMEPAQTGTPVISIEQALQAAPTNRSGEQMQEIELEFAGGRWVYSADEVSVDAITGEVLDSQSEED